MSSPNQIPALQKEKSKYKIGDRVWCRIYNGVLDNTKLLYVGPATIVHVYKQRHIYRITCPVDVVSGGRTWEPGIDTLLLREDSIDYLL